MAVFTHVGAEDIAAFLRGFGIGPLTSAKGIAEGVENSNYLVDAGGTRYILTLYERRVDPDDLPFFIALTDHLANDGLPVPRFLPDLSGQHVQQLAGRAACLIQFLPGVSVTRPSGRHAYAAGMTLARMHDSTVGFDAGPANAMGLSTWPDLLDRLGTRADMSWPGLHELLATEINFLRENWPHDLPHGVIHADLFPDNVLMSDDEVSGVIDFYFSCRDVTLFDLAIMHSAWCFSPDGTHHQAQLAAGIIAGYESVRHLTDVDRAALPVLARGAAVRFLLTRALDWIDTPPDALVIRKDPTPYLRRLELYQSARAADIFRR